MPHELSLEGELRLEMAAIHEHIIDYFLWDLFPLFIGDFEEIVAHQVSRSDSLLRV